MNELLSALWFFLPAGVANMMPVLANKIPFANRWTATLDGGRLFRGKPIFGPHKTWRGLTAGIIGSTTVFWIQQMLVTNTGWAQAFAGGIDYAALPLLIVGPLFGIGALGGDAIESFFKRQRGIKSGKSWFPFDQIDYIIGGAIVTAPFVSLSLLTYLLVLICWLILHVVFSYIGYLLKLKEHPI